MSSVSNEQLLTLLKEVSEKLQNQDDRITKINERTAAMASNMDKIRLSLLGSDQLGVKGIVSRVSDLEKKDEKRALREAKIMGAGVIITGLLAWLKEVFKH